MTRKKLFIVVMTVVKNNVQYNNCTQFLAMNKEEAIGIGINQAKIDFPPEEGWYSHQAQSDKGSSEEELFDLFSGKITLNGTSIFSKEQEAQIQELKKLFEQLDMLAMLKVEKTGQHFSEKILERSSSSEDGFYLYLAGGEPFKPGVYFLCDGPGGRESLNPDTRVGKRFSLGEIANAWIFDEGGIKEMDYIIRFVKEWLDDHIDNYISDRGVK